MAALVFKNPGRNEGPCYIPLTYTVPKLDLFLRPRIRPMIHVMRIPKLGPLNIRLAESEADIEWVL